MMVDEMQALRWLIQQFDHQICVAISKVFSVE
jgi:hypothetical protein